jgi:hypothetical protein
VVVCREREGEKERRKEREKGRNGERESGREGKEKNMIYIYDYNASYSCAGNYSNRTGAAVGQCMVVCKRGGERRRRGKEEGREKKNVIHIYDYNASYS